MQQIDFVSLLLIVIDFAIAIAFSICLQFIHYGIFKSEKLKKIQSKLIRHAYHFVFGIVYGLGFLAIFWCREALFANRNVYIPLILMISIFTCGFFINKYIFIYSMIPMFGACFFFYPITSVILWLMIIAGILHCLILLINDYFRHKSRFWFFIWTTIILFWELLINLWITAGAAWLYITIIIAAAYVSSFMFYEMYSLFYKFYNKMNIIAKKTLYDNKHFLHANFVESFFKKEIWTRNNNQALLLTFDISHLNEIIVNEKHSIYLQIIQSIYDILHNYFTNNDCMFIKTNHNTFGVILFDKQYEILDLKESYSGNTRQFRTDKDPLKSLENIVNSLPTELQINNQKINFEIRAFCSIYGIHCCDINRLIEYNTKLANDFSYGHNLSIIQLFNPLLIEKATTEQADYINLCRNFDLSSIKISLQHMEFLNGDEALLPVFVQAKNFTNNIDDILKQVSPEYHSLLLRNLAMRTVDLYCKTKEFNKQNLWVFYPTSELLKAEFSPQKIVDKLKSFNIKINKIFLIIDCGIKTPFVSLFNTNLTLLERTGINFVLTNLSDFNILKGINPAAITLSKLISLDSKIYDKSIAICKQLKMNLLLDFNN